MDVDTLTPVNRDLLVEAMPGGELVNELYRAGARVEQGFLRERRCFALGERGWLTFLGWEGMPARATNCRSHWALTAAALEALAGSAIRT